MSQLDSDHLSKLVYLITGPVGAGKTKTSRHLANRLPLAAHLETDEIQNLIVSGGLHPQQKPETEARRQLDLRRRNAALLADSFFESGVTPMVDEAITYLSDLQRYASLIKSRPLALVVLAPPHEVSLARDAARLEKNVGHIWSSQDRIIREQLRGVGLWVDNSEMTAAQTVDYILEHVLTEGILSVDQLSNST